MGRPNPPLVIQEHQLGTCLESFGWTHSHIFGFPIGDSDVDSIGVSVSSSSSHN
jgi:hypothetical protein